MRISELATRTGVPVPTLKFYLRERVLHPGRATSRTSAEYDEGHVERVRLLRVLAEHGGISVADLRVIVAALEAPPPSRHELLGAAHDVLPGARTGTPAGEEVTGLFADLGWPVPADAAFAAGLGEAVDAARAAGVPITPTTLRRYAAAMRHVAEVDVGLALAAASPADALRTVVVGTVLVDPVLAALRRVAQQVVSTERA
ncbi:MerR family transcriptional regulator [Phycicoccus endophyticus]|uniref:MerR family transcriptional regulator n=1 Tax=Phycicoccus endophyticus TaxID=1690220 RepID=A0A7G9QYC5_9MICO|nr:MerR family transcriptional regulator [Phycicoccus endophyticus]NHI19243.1 MerR family transcriptional regulator [Phycicoccus endophyticus]QNN48350.1 MerR family transcriptional regulator [Phycicoccus endophyticus]GGL41264.1 MerR family transcriptional regulator [Phycicoccus endophyticus]